MANFLACHCRLIMGSIPRSWCVQKGEAIPRHKGGFTRVLNCGVPPLTIVASSRKPPLSRRSGVVSNTPCWRMSTFE